MHKEMKGIYTEVDELDITKQTSVEKSEMMLPS
jgi:hypothetical protein